MQAVLKAQINKTDRNDARGFESHDGRALVPIPKRSTSP
jgi:hypothetical protein